MTQKERYEYRILDIDCCTSCEHSQISEGSENGSLYCNIMGFYDSEVEPLGLCNQYN